MFLSGVRQFTENDLEVDQFAGLSAKQKKKMFSGSVAKVREGAISH